MAEPENVSIRYRRDASDYAALRQQSSIAFWRGPRGQMLYYGSIAGAFAATIALLLIVRSYADLPPAIFIVTVVVLYLGFRYVLFTAVPVLFPIWLYGPAGRFDVDATTTLDEKGMRTETDDGESYLVWRAIRSMVETKNHFHFFSDRGVSFPIPKRAFMNDGEMRAFAEVLRSRIGRAQP